MTNIPDKCFFAGYRGYYTDGTTFLQIIGLSSINNQSYHVRESKLNEHGIKLGDFLSATVPLGERVKNFLLQKYKIKVKVDGNFAMVEDQEGDLQKNSEGVLVFRTKTFGSVWSVNQNLPLGKYRITVRATKTSEEDLFKTMKYCADVQEKISSSSEASPTSNAKVIVGTGFSMESLSLNNNKILMRAFVTSSIKKGDQNTYFLWICDNRQKSIFSSKTHHLAVGHFFEGVFEEKDTQKSKWQCLKYVKEINALLEGSVIGNKIELKTTIDRYQSAEETRKKYPQCYAKYFGKIIDNKEKLPSNCNGRQVKTQLCKVGDDFRWVVTELM